MACQRMLSNILRTSKALLGAVGSEVQAVQGSQFGGGSAVFIGFLLHAECTLGSRARGVYGH